MTRFKNSSNTMNEINVGNKESNKRNIYPAETRIETTNKMVCNFSNLLNAEDRCHRGVGYKNSVSSFHLYKLSKCFKIYEELINGTYETQKGDNFEVFEPKHRIVTSTKYRDRIPQSCFITNYFYPNVPKVLIYRNFACLKNKGIELARNQFKEILRKSELNEFVLKVDFKNYFGSIPHDKLFNEMDIYIHDEWCRKFFRNVIDSNEQSVGITLGSEINQLFATTYP